MLNLKFVDNLIPVIVQDEKTHAILMMAYANEEAVGLTRKTGFAHYYSRSRKKLWKRPKGCAAQVYVRRSRPGQGALP